MQVFGKLNLDVLHDLQVHMTFLQAESFCILDISVEVCHDYIVQCTYRQYILSCFINYTTSLGKKEVFQNPLPLILSYHKF